MRIHFLYIYIDIYRHIFNHIHLFSCTVHVVMLYVYLSVPVRSTLIGRLLVITTNTTSSRGGGGGGGGGGQIWVSSLRV